MITIEQYFGIKPHTPEQRANAVTLLGRVNALLDEAHAAGAYDYEIDPDTGTQISGSKGGAGDGGFRLPSSTTGAPLSTHRNAEGVDPADPVGRLNRWITRKTLVKHDLYREHPKATPVWCHLQTRPPKSKCRTFIP